MTRGCTSDAVSSDDIRHGREQAAHEALAVPPEPVTLHCAAAPGVPLPVLEHIADEPPAALPHGRRIGLREKLASGNRAAGEMFGREKRLRAAEFVQT